MGLKKTAPCGVVRNWKWSWRLEVRAQFAARRVSDLFSFVQRSLNVHARRSTRDSVTTSILPPSSETLL